MPQLDFSGIDSLFGGDTDASRHPSVNPEAGNRHDEHREDTGNGAMWASLRRDQQIYDELQSSYRRLQDNVTASSQLKSELLHDMEGGVSILDLLLKACRIIALMTGDEAFMSTMEENLKSIYGYGFSDPIALEHELADLRQRKMQLEESLKDSSMAQDCRKRIEAAIKAHSKRETEILDKLSKH